MKGPGTSFQSPVLSQNYVRNVSLVLEQILIVLRIQKK